MNKTVSHTLIDFGLTDKEASVYIACLDSENQTPTQISRKTGIARSSIYDISMSLALKGLLVVKQGTGLEKQQTLINAVNPENLRLEVQKRRKALRNPESNLLNSIPLMKSKYFGNKNRDSKTEVIFIDGYDDFIKEYYGTDRNIQGEEVYAWDSWLPVDTHGIKLGDKDVSQAVKNLKRTPEQRMEIIPNNERARYAVGYHFQREPEYFNLIQHRFTDISVFELYNRIEITGENIYIFSNQREEVYAIKIRSQNLATSLK